MATKYIIGSVVGAFALAYAFDSAISDRKLFGGEFGWFNFKHSKFECSDRV